MSTVLIIGVTSAIAQAVARRFARDGTALFITARDQSRLDTVAEDLQVRGARRVSTFVFDADDFERHHSLVEAIRSAFPEGLDSALIAYGTLPDPEKIAIDADAVAEAFTTNATSVVALMTRLAGLFEEQGRGNLTVISSVAGDRGRPSNYVYGAAKGAVSLFAQGLRAHLAKHGIRVTTIKPGLVETPMTEHLPQNRLFANPEKVGRRIHRAMRRGEDVVYVPAFWRPVMAAIRLIPERIFKKLNL